MIFLICPVLTFLMTEAMQASGISALYICGVFQGLYTSHNLIAQARQFIAFIVTGIVHTTGQIAHLLIGIVTPHFICRVLFVDMKAHERTFGRLVGGGIGFGAVQYLAMKSYKRIYLYFMNSDEESEGWAGSPISSYHYNITQ